MKKFIVAAALIAAFLVTASAVSSDRQYGVVKLQGSVNPIIAEHIGDSIRDASDHGYQFIVIQLDTPGGLMGAMRDIIKDILASDIPVIVFTYPQGGQAASAGGFIMLAADIAVMAPATEIGAMHPVAPTLDFVPQDEDGVPDGPMEKKVLNDTIAYARSLAQQKDRNEEWAEEAVRAAISNTYLEALDEGVIDFIAEDMDDLLSKLDGYKLVFKGGEIVLDTSGLRRFDYEMTWQQNILNTLADPQMVMLLFMIAIAGIGIEFKSPGLIVPGVAGVVSLILFLMAINILPINVFGLILIVFAIVLFVLELQFVSYGLLTLGGLVSFVAGAMFLFDSPLPGGHIPLHTIFITLAIILFLVFVVLRLILKSHRNRVTTGLHALEGKTGEVLRFSDGTGKVLVFGEIWNIVSDDDLKPGDEVIVNRVSGMKLHVKKYTQQI